METFVRIQSDRGQFFPVHFYYCSGINFNLTWLVGYGFSRINALYDRIVMYICETVEFLFEYGVILNRFSVYLTILSCSLALEFIFVHSLSDFLHSTHNWKFAVYRCGKMSNGHNTKPIWIEWNDAIIAYSRRIFWTFAKIVSESGCFIGIQWREWREIRITRQRRWFKSGHKRA